MKKIYILTLLLCFTSLGSSFAQTLKGHIYDANTNEPLVGAAVAYKLQGNQGVVSDIHGAYEIKLPEGPSPRCTSTTLAAFASSGVVTGETVCPGCSPNK